VKAAVKLLDQFVKAGFVSPDLKAADLVKALISSGLINAERLARPYMREALPSLGQRFDENADEATALLGLQKSGRPKNSAPYRQDDIARPAGRNQRRLSRGGLDLTWGSPT
jgi:hypothetical protein